MKTASAIITFVLMGAGSVVLFFFLLLGLNSFSERDTNAAIIFYVVWLLFFAAAVSTGALFLTKFLIAKSFNAILAVTLSVTAAIAVGLVCDFGGLLASTIIASEMRNSRIKQ